MEDMAEWEQSSKVSMETGAAIDNWTEKKNNEKNRMEKQKGTLDVLVNADSLSLDCIRSVTDSDGKAEGGKKKKRTHGDVARSLMLLHGLADESWCGARQQRWRAVTRSPSQQDVQVEGISEGETQR